MSWNFFKSKTIKVKVNRQSWNVHHQSHAQVQYKHSKSATSSKENINHMHNWYDMILWYPIFLICSNESHMEVEIRLQIYLKQSPL